MNRRTAPWSWIVIVVVLGLVARYGHRALVHEQAGYDLGLSNVLPSFFTIVLFVFVLSRWRMVSGWAFVGLLLGSLSYELSQMEYFRGMLPVSYSDNQTFDVWDILGSIVGWLVAVGLVHFAGSAMPSTPQHVAEQSFPGDARKGSRG